MRMHLQPLYKTLFFIGILFFIINGFAQNAELHLGSGDQEEGWVVVEPTAVQSIKNENVYELVPYNKRRPLWGLLLGLSYSFFEPINYDPRFLSQSFGEAYDKADNPLLELVITAKKHFSFMALGLDLGLGSYGANSITGSTSSLSLYVARVGAKVLLDQFSEEPLLIPYASVGTYVVYFQESLEATTFEGNTEPALYYSAGVMIQLDRLEKSAARVAYEEQGMENSYFFVEARQFLGSSNDFDPNFESDIHANVGLNIEF